jgi:DNA-binding MarR family transcriptional regulator
MTFKTGNNIGVLIKKAARLFEQVANKDLEDLGVTYAQTTFLIRLWEKDGQNQMELTKSSGLKQPTVVRILDRMERDNLISRIKNSEDRRIFNFYLTDKARDICKKLEYHANGMQAIAGKRLTKSEMENLKNNLLRIIDNLEAELN